jgi:hypothetical protein
VKGAVVSLGFMTPSPILRSSLALTNDREVESQGGGDEKDDFQVGIPM